jgi:hypothetical protein
VPQPVTQPADGPKGSIAFGYEAIGVDFCDFDLDDLPALTYLNGPATPNFVNGMVYPIGEDNLAYASCYGSTNLYTIDHTTLAWSNVGNIGVSMGELTVDPSDGTIYGTDGISLYSIDPTVPSSTLIGAHGAANTIIEVVCDGNGDMWGNDVAFSPPTYFYSIDKTTGTATSVGNLGFTACYAQGAVYDQATDQVILAAFNYGNFTAEIRAVDVTTGSSTILSSFYYNEISAACLPVSSGGGALKGLLGYIIYRDGARIDTVMSPDTLFYYDFTVNPGTHSYAVSAWYDLTEYLTPPPPPLTVFDESMLEGPVDIDIECGRELPFFEPWTNGSFTFNDWTLSSPTNTNWSVSASIGNPAPSADFSWVPIQYDYSLSLETPVLNAGPFTCAMIWCDFDYKLIDRNSTGAEKLFVDVFAKGTWKKVAEFSNTASKDWTPMHVDISGAKGKAFKVRFRAAGANSADILHWYVDNVHIYAKCNPPVQLANPSTSGYDVTLTWSEPICGSEGPPPTWITWDDGTNSGAIGLTAGGSWDVGAKWDPSMIATLDGGSVTKIKIYPYAAGTFILRVWNSDDGTNLIYEEPVSVTVGDWNEFSLTTPPAIDVTKALWVGYNLTHSAGTYPAGYDPGPCMVGYGLLGNLGTGWEDLNAYGFDYNWDIEVEIQGVKDSQKPVSLKQTPIVNVNPQLASNGKVNTHSSISTHTSAPMAVSALLGYNIYRSDDHKVTYNKLNTTLLTDTNYVDVVPSSADYYYYVTSVFPSYGTATCESDSSNVVAVLLTGIDQLNGGKISIYPNPATDNVFVKSDFTITNIEVLNYIGQTVYTRQNVSAKTIKVNVANLTTGVYFVKVTTVEGIKTAKITVTR